MPSEPEFLPASNADSPLPDALPVLIVDDDPVILAMLRDVLEEAGMMVLTARDGKAALALLQHTPVGLVLTDLMMPFVTGFQLAQQLHGNPASAGIPVVLMSAAFPPHMAGLFAAIVPKPFVLDELVETVRQFRLSPGEGTGKRV
jgi:CheY-like chemotaxis protein